MNNFTVHFEIPEEINSGLRSKAYERFGGVIRDSQTKQVVAMLRETAPDMTHASTILSQLGRVSSFLNLTITAIGFIMIGKKLDAIEQKIEILLESLNALHHKYDTGIDAKFKSALILAQDCTTTSNQDNRLNMGSLAISKLLELEHIYTVYLDKALENDIEIADKYFKYLSLCYIAKARCYLELNEKERASSSVKEAMDFFKKRSCTYASALTSFNKKNYETGMQIAVVTGVMKNFLPFMPISATPEEADKVLSIFRQSEIKQKADEKIRDIQSIPQFFEGYYAEIKGLELLETSFREWQDLPLLVPSNKKRSGLMYILPSKTIS